MTNTQLPNENRRLTPTNWRHQDIVRLGLPRYSADNLAGMKSELRDGAGFALVHDLVDAPDSVNDVEEAGRRLLLFGQRLGRLLPQNSLQEQLVQIADFSDEDDFDDRGYRSPGELTPHTDPPPLIVLFCLRSAQRGGANRLVSAEAIRDAIQDENLDLLTVLEAGFPFFMPDEKIQGGGRNREALPILLDGPGGISCVYYRPFIERAAEVAGVPLPSKSIEALDTFDRFANEADLRVEFTLNPGETLILNNYRVLHARDEFVDWPEKNKRRCLLRLWLDADWLPDPPPPHAGRRNPMTALL